MNRYNLFSLLFVAVSALAIGTASAAADGCKPERSFTTVNPGKLTVALTITPPYSLERDGHIAGIDGFLVKQFAKDNCLDIIYTKYTYPGAISATSTHRVDVAIGGFYRTKKRAEVVDLSAPVYFDQMSVYSHEGWQTLEALKGKTVGTVQGYLWVPALKKLSDTTVYPDSLNLAQAFHAGRIQAAVDGYGAAVMQNKGRDDISIHVLQPDPKIEATVNPSQTSFLLNKNNGALSDAMDKAIEKWRDNGLLVKALAEYELPASAADIKEAYIID